MKSQATSIILPLLAIFVTLLLWSSAFVVIRHLLHFFTPLGLASFRTVIAIVSLSWYVALTKHDPTDNLRKSDLGLFAAFGLLGIVGYNVGINWGEETVPAATASFLVAQIPIATILIEVLFFRRRKLGTVTKVGLLFGFGGTLIILLEGGGSGSLASLGVIWIAFGVVSESAYFVLQQDAIKRLGAFNVNFLTMFAAALLMMPFLPSLYRPGVSPTATAWLLALYLGLFPSACAYFLWTYAIGRMGAVAATSALYALPFITLFIAFVFLDELPSLVSLAGGVIALLGAYLAHRGGHRRSAANSR